MKIHSRPFDDIKTEPALVLKVKINLLNFSMVSFETNMPDFWAFWSLLYMPVENFSEDRKGL